MSVRVHFLGSGDAFGSDGRMQACILVESGETSFLLDCGASSLIALKGAEIPPNRIDTVLVTHLHGDHFGGLPFLVLDGQFSRRSQGLRVAGPRGIKARVEAAMEVLFPGSWASRRKFDVDFIELAPDVTAALHPLRVTAYEVVHPSGAPALALRVEIGGRVIAYSGDTEWTESLVAASDGADLFICEAYFYEKHIPFHLDYSTLMRHRSRLDCKSIVLTHVSADLLRHRHELALPLAHDGLEIVLEEH